MIDGAYKTKYKLLVPYFYYFKLKQMDYETEIGKAKAPVEILLWPF